MYRRVTIAGIVGVALIAAVYGGLGMPTAFGTAGPGDQSPQADAPESAAGPTQNATTTATTMSTPSTTATPPSTTTPTTEAPTTTPSSTQAGQQSAGQQAEHYVIVRGGSPSNVADYRFTVSESLAKAEGQSGWPVPPERISVDADDTVDGLSATGGVAGGSDAFWFDGDIACFQVSDGSAVTVYVDGERIAPDSVAGGTDCDAGDASDGDSNAGSDDTNAGDGDSNAGDGSSDGGNGDANAGDSNTGDSDTGDSDDGDGDSSSGDGTSDAANQSNDTSQPSVSFPSCTEVRVENLKESNWTVDYVSTASWILDDWTRDGPDPVDTRRLGLPENDSGPVYSYANESVYSDELYAISEIRLESPDGESRTWSSPHDCAFVVGVNETGGGSSDAGDDDSTAGNETNNSSRPTVSFPSCTEVRIEGVQDSEWELEYVSTHGWIIPDWTRTGPDPIDTHRLGFPQNDTGPVYTYANDGTFSDQLYVIDSVMLISPDGERRTWSNPRDCEFVVGVSTNGTVHEPRE